MKNMYVCMYYVEGGGVLKWWNEGEVGGNHAVYCLIFCNRNKTEGRNQRQKGQEQRMQAMGGGSFGSSLLQSYHFLLTRVIVIICFRLLCPRVFFPDAAIMENNPGDEVVVHV